MTLGMTLAISLGFTLGWLPAIVGTTGVLLSADARAEHRKTDVITLYNGDRITGEIQSLISGRLALGTDAMGTLSIEWKEVASVASNYNYELRLTSGDRFFGSVAPGALPGRVAFQDVFGAREFAWDEIVELRPVEDTITDRLEVYLSANYAFTKASGVQQTEFRANVAYEDERARNSLTSRATLSSTENDATQSSRVALNRLVWTDRQSLYRQVFGGYESNDELGLDYRLTAGAGLGRYFVDTNNQTVTASLSLQALEERSVGGDTQASVEAVLSAVFSRWRFDSPQLDFTVDAQVYPSLTESGRVRADSNATLRWELIEDVYWNLSAWGSYDNEAVEDAAGEFDWGVTTGLGWQF